METTDINWLTNSQIRSATSTLVRAFRKDPVARYLFPDDSRRAHLLPWYLGSALRYCSNYGEVYSTEALDGVAAWLPPGRTRVSNYWHMFRSGMLLAPLKVGPPAFSRLMALTACMDAAHERWAPGRHWYLLVLGVEPSGQGCGIGGALIEPVLARADAEGIPCYLETQYEWNLSFYGRYGFEVVEEGAVPNGGPWVWFMVRQPGERLAKSESKRQREE